MFVRFSQIFQSGKRLILMYEYLVKSGVDLDTADEFEKLAPTCLQHNNCLFDGKTFKFPGEVPMGGPMSSIIAEDFMDRLERWVLNRWFKFDNVVLWYRYVDDIFCIWRGSDGDLERFQALLHFFFPFYKL